MTVTTDGFEALIGQTPRNIHAEVLVAKLCGEVILLRQAAEKSASMATAAKAMIAAYDKWCECASGTPEDTIACGTMLARSSRLRKAIAAYEAQQ